jgi:YfiH family protein
MPEALLQGRSERSLCNVIHPSIFPYPISAGFSTREGGVSAGPYAALNLGLSTADDPANVAQNRGIMAARFGRTNLDLAIAGQVHGSDVLEVHSPGLYSGYDGLVTGTPGLLLSISAADCAAILLADPEARVVGACHAGWRGHVGGVAKNTIDAMLRMGAERGRILAYVSPCISVAHFEVGEEVAEQFDDSFVLRRPEWPRPHVDLSSSIRHLLVKEGLSQAHVEVSGACTFAEPEHFFSHRAQNGITGRMMGMICVSASSVEEKR